MWAWVTCGSLERAEPVRGNTGRQCGTGRACEAVNINKGAIPQWIPVVRFILQEYWWCGVYRGCFGRGGLLTLLEALFSLEAERFNLSIHWWAALRILLQANCNRSFLSLFFSLVKKKIISLKKQKTRRERDTQVVTFSISVGAWIENQKKSIFVIHDILFRPKKKLTLLRSFNKIHAASEVQHQPV